MRAVWVVVLVVVVLALVVGLAVARVHAARQRRAMLRERFGEEYDRAVGAGDRRAAERRLAALAETRSHLVITPLTLDRRVVYQEEWTRVQSQFVDDPGGAVAKADTLVNDVLHERGYRTEAFEDRAALLATDHTDVVRDYRLAHEAYGRHLESGRSDTEDLRQAFVHYRSLFETLTADPHEGDEPPRGRHVDHSREGAGG